MKRFTENFIICHLKFSPPSVILCCSPSLSPETKLFKWLTSSAFQSSSSLCLLNGSRFERTLPENNTGSWWERNLLMNQNAKLLWKTKSNSFFHTLPRRPAPHRLTRRIKLMWSPLECERAFFAVFSRTQAFQFIRPPPPCAYYIRLLLPGGKIVVVSLAWFRKNVITCGMIVSLERRSWSPIVAISIPSIKILPPALSRMRNKAKVREDFPAPVRPTIPICWNDKIESNVKAYLETVFLCTT